MLSLASASCFVTNQSCSIHCYEFAFLVPILILLSDCFNSSSLFAVANFVHTFAPRKRHLRCWYLQELRVAAGANVSGAAWTFTISCYSAQLGSLDRRRRSPTAWLVLLARWDPKPRGRSAGILLELMRFDMAGGSSQKYGRVRASLVDFPEPEWQNCVISNESRNGLEQTWETASLRDTSC